MKYTEEEFYGNTQNTVLENGEVKPTNEPVEQENKADIGGTIFTTFLKTVAVIVGSLFYIMAISVCLSPRFAIRVYDFFGAKEASLTCYERVYEKSGNLADLYNLVQKSIQVKNHKKTSKYISKLQNANGYNDFCIEVNNATLEVTDKKYVAYVGDLDGYLVSQKIMAFYKNGDKIKAKEVAIKDLIENQNVYSFGLSTYVECLMKDNSLTDNQKKTRLNELKEESVIVDSQNKTVFELIEEKRERVDYTLSSGEVDEILRVYTSLKIENLKLRFYENSNEDGLANQTRNQINELQNRYETLINN